MKSIGLGQEEIQTVIELAMYKTKMEDREK